MVRDNTSDTGIIAHDPLEVLGSVKCLMGLLTLICTPTLKLPRLNVLKTPVEMLGHRGEFLDT